MSRKDLELSENEQEMYEAMKAEPESEPEPEPEEAETSKTDKKAEPEEAEVKPRDEKGRFAKAEGGEEEEPETEAEAEPEKPADRRVPLRAVQEERERRKDSENELAQLRAELAQLRESVRPQPQAQQAPAEPAKMPDPIMEPDKFNAWLGERLSAAEKPVQDMTAQQKQAAEQARHIQALKGFAEQHEAQFRQTYADRDYDGALSFARQKVTENLRMLGYPENALPMMVAQQEMQLTATAAQNGISPAAYVYNYALNLGFDDTKTTQASDSGKVARLAEVQKKTQSGAKASGGPKDEEWTLERIARIADKGSEKEAAAIPDHVLKKFMGG